MIDTIYKSIPHVLFLGEQGEDGDTCVFVKADQSILTAMYRKLSHLDHYLYFNSVITT